MVTQTGAGAAIRVQDSADPDATPFVVDTSGQVGIGTATPGNALDIAGGTFQISSAGGTARSTISADTSNSYFAASDDRNFVVQTNTTTRLTVNSSTATSTVPVVLPANPTTSLQAATKAYVDLGSPAGIVAPFAGTSAPSGWLACNGAAVSRTDYATLFAAIGTTWGVGDGSTTFNVPDLRGTFLRGTGTNGTYGTAVGQAVGTYAADTYLNHSHAVTDSGHSHGTSNGGNFIVTGGGTSAGVGTGTSYVQIGSTGTSTTGLTVNTSTTGGTETKPKNYGVLYIIKT